MINVQLPKSISGDLYHFMASAKPKDTINCIVEIQDLATQHLHSDAKATLMIGDKKLNHIVENIYTARNLTKKDLECIYDIIETEQCVKTVNGSTTGICYLQVSVIQKVHWIKQIEAAKPLFPALAEVHGNYNGNPVKAYL